MLDYLLVCNDGYSDFTSNSIQHILKYIKNPNISVYCSDEKSLEKLNKKYNQVSNINLFLYEEEKLSESFEEYGTENFNKIMKKLKIGSILTHMEKSDNQILYLDSDVVLFKEPNLNNYKKCDLVFAPENMENKWVCAGFMFINNTENAKKILEIIYQDSTNRNDQEVAFYYLNKNGDVLNFTENNTKIGVFDREFYVSGWLRRVSPMKELCNKNVVEKRAVMYHANLIIGKDAKLNDLKYMGCWLEE